MAVDIFLRLDTIPGESIDRVFRGQIPLRSVASGLHTPVQLSGPEAGAGKAGPDRLVVTKWVDSSSVLLAKALTTGAELATGRISFRNPADLLVFLTMDFNHVFVSDIQSEISPGDERPGDQVTLTFGEIAWTYARKNPDGSTSQTQWFWSFITNSPHPA
jgi:type VI secretion system secreted protein Hcp